jgi:exosortase B
MNTMTQTPGQGKWPNLVGEWWPVLLGLLVLYFPSFHDLARETTGLWRTDDQAHGPIILVVIFYLFWEKYPALFQTPAKPLPVFGSIVFVFGLLLFALGRSQEILLFELGSLVPVLGGILLAVRGLDGLRVFWFPVLFSVFLIPLPGLLVDAATGPLKQHISEIAEEVLYQVGYPIARDGVTIIIGQYQLLVADACSGLHSMFSLSAVGLLYLHLMGYKNMFRNGLLVAVILPIAFITNIVRVMILILVTFHLGDEAGQGVIHGLAGNAMFVIALLLLFLFDSLLGKVPGFRERPKAANPAQTEPLPSPVSGPN